MRYKQRAQKNAKVHPSLGITIRRDKALPPQVEAEKAEAQRRAETPPHPHLDRRRIKTQEVRPRSCRPHQATDDLRQCSDVGGGCLPRFAETCISLAVTIHLHFVCVCVCVKRRVDVCAPLQTSVASSAVSLVSTKRHASPPTLCP